MQMQEELIFKEEVYRIVGAAMEVHSELGTGFSEAIYQEAMELESGWRSIPFEPQRKLEVRYKGRLLKKWYCADLLCFGKIIVEIKVLDRVYPQDEAQLLNYLKATGLQVGIILCFGNHSKLEWKRMVMTRFGPLDPDEEVC